MRPLMGGPKGPHYTVRLKADTTAVRLKADTTAVRLKADTTAVRLKADTTYYADSKPTGVVNDPATTSLPSTTWSGSAGRLRGAGPSTTRAPFRGSNCDE